MNRKYLLSFFLFGLVMNFFLRYFYLFIPGLVLCIIGIWNLPCLLIGIAVLGLDLLLSFLEQFQTREASLKESDNPEYNKFMDACFGEGAPGLKELLAQKMEEQEAIQDSRQKLLESLTVYRQLQKTVHDGMTLNEIVDAFCQMCNTSVGEPDDLLFETGTFSFTGEKQFYFSLVRQFRFGTESDEYVQLHVDVLYAPSPKTAKLKKSHWSSPKNEDFFKTVKNSAAYHTVCDAPYTKVQVWIGET